MKKNIIIATGIISIFVCLFVNAIERTGIKAEIIKQLPDKTFTVSKLLELTQELSTNNNQQIILDTNTVTSVKTTKKVRRKRGIKRNRLFIDLDGDGVSDDRNL